MQKAIIVDLDGTLANVDHRVKYVQQKPKDYEKFYAGLLDDTVNQWCHEIMMRFSNTHTIIICTCRERKYREMTRKWLRDNKINYDMLLMRENEGHGHDDKWKKEMYDNSIKDIFDVEFVIGDRDSVVKMWREKGLVCLQPDYGDF